MFTSFANYLQDHSNALLLGCKLCSAAAQGNAHALELLAAALAMHLRFYCQGLLDTLGPLLRQWLGRRGEGLAAAMHRQVEGVERNVLELLTLRRERDWLGLARLAEIMRKACICLRLLSDAIHSAPATSGRSSRGPFNCTVAVCPAPCRSFRSTCASFRAI